MNVSILFEEETDLSVHSHYEVDSLRNINTSYFGMIQDGVGKLHRLQGKTSHHIAKLLPNVVDKRTKANRERKRKVVTLIL